MSFTQKLAKWLDVPFISIGFHILYCLIRGRFSEVQLIPFPAGFLHLGVEGVHNLFHIFTVMFVSIYHLIKFIKI